MILTKLLLALLSLFYQVWTSEVQVSIDREIARWRHLGQPTTYDELAKAYQQIPEGEIDASAEWAAVVEYFGSDDFQASAAAIPRLNYRIEIPPPTEPWKEQSQVEPFLQKHAAGLQFIRKAAAKKGVARFPIAFHEGRAAMLPHLNSLADASKCIELEFHLALRAKDSAKAAECIDLLDSFANALAFEPFVIGQVIHLAIVDRKFKSISLLLESMEVDDAHLKKWSDELLAFDPQITLARAFQGENVNAIQGFGDANAFPSEEYSPYRYGALYPIHPIQLLCYMHAARPAQEAIQESFPKAVRVLWNIENWKFESDVSAYEYHRRAFVRRAYPPLGTFAAGVGRTAAKCRATAALIATVRYQRAKGAWPESLEALVPEYLPAVPLDPYREAPLSFRKSDREITVYGFGFNEKEEIDSPHWMEVDDVVVLKIAK